MPKPSKNKLQELMSYMKIKYLDGKNPMGRAMTQHGFFTSKNAALNIGKMMSVPYDPQMRIRKNDPAAELRANTARIGQVERIHNVYLNPRVKLAD